MESCSSFLVRRINASLGAELEQIFDLVKVSSHYGVLQHRAAALRVEAGAWVHAVAHQNPQRILVVMVQRVPHELSVVVVRGAEQPARPVLLELGPGIKESRGR